MPDMEKFYNDLININLYINIFFFLYFTMHLSCVALCHLWKPNNEISMSIHF